MANKIMALNKEVLKSMGFDHFVRQDSDCFTKSYPDFRLFLSEAENGRNMASLKIGEKDINLPEIKHLDWVKEFDLENS